MNPIEETAINIISEGTRIEGTLFFDDVCRVHGTLVGKVNAKEGSTLILSESSMVDGDIHADSLIVEGYVSGNIIARTRVTIAGTGRVIGNITAPSLKLEFGAYFEGQAKTVVTKDLAPTPA